MRNFIKRYGAFVGGIILGAVACWLAVTPVMVKQLEENREMRRALAERVEAQRPQSIAGQLVNEGVGSIPVPEVEQATTHSGMEEERLANRDRLVWTNVEEVAEIASLRERLRETQHALLNDDVAEARAIVDAALAETEVSDD